MGLGEETVLSRLTPLILIQVGLYECMHTIQQLIDTLKLEDSGVPIYVQLREQFLRAMADGRLLPGDQMPTMRQVAGRLPIDLNTVRRAYDALERMKAVALVRGRGSFVANLPDFNPVIITSALDQLARQTLAAARANNIDVTELSQRLIELATDKED